MTKLLITGCKGRMGQAIIEAAEQAALSVGVYFEAEDAAVAQTHLLGREIDGQREARMALHQPEKLFNYFFI